MPQWQSTRSGKQPRCLAGRPLWGTRARGNAPHSGTFQPRIVWDGGFPTQLRQPSSSRHPRLGSTCSRYRFCPPRHVSSGFSSTPLRFFSPPPVHCGRRSASSSTACRDGPSVLGRHLEGLQPETLWGRFGGSASESQRTLPSGTFFPFGGDSTPTDGSAGCFFLTRDRLTPSRTVATSPEDYWWVLLRGTFCAQDGNKIAVVQRNATGGS
jgi:hypothetical protein